MRADRRMKRQTVRVSHAEQDTFTPPGIIWQSIDPALTKARWTSWTLGFLAVVVALAIGWFIPQIPGWVMGISTAVVLACYLWGLWYFKRRTNSWMYAEREDDLIVRRGILFRRLVIVPYGRMQLVDLAAGPIDRKFDISTLQLHTAAATTDASIPGLKPVVASALRDRLAELGEERAAGL